MEKQFIENWRLIPYNFSRQRKQRKLERERKDASDAAVSATTNSAKPTKGNGWKQKTWWTNRTSKLEQILPSYASKRSGRNTKSRIANSPRQWNADDGKCWPRTYRHGWQKNQNGQETKTTEPPPNSQTPMISSPVGCSTDVSGNPQK